MRLLFITQTVDRNDSVLGAYHEWITHLAARMESIEVICLYEGQHDLPQNVSVHSLGKEKGRAPALVYAGRFVWLAWKLRRQYEAVFVHMNQEYVLIAGPMWKLLGKRIYLWRNHYAGSWLTDFAALWCDKVFCTSRHSYTARYEKTVFMPVGVDTGRFRPDASVIREPRSILFLARISPSKRVDMFIEALGLLIDRGTSFIASVYGSPLPADERYYATLKQRVEELGLHGRVRFHDAVPNGSTPDVYRAHELFVNCSPSGMFDKTLFEAASTGCIVLAQSEDFAALAQDARLSFDGAETLAEDLETILALPDVEKRELAMRAEQLAGTQDHERLMEALVRELAV